MPTWAEARAKKEERLRREQRLYTLDRRGHRCAVCGNPTVAGIDYHPCCIEPELMRRGRPTP